MRTHYSAKKISEKVFWVGAIDWNLRDFHGYDTGRGTTYNAYLILSDKITLIDTVKAPFVDEMLARIGSVVEPSRIDYIISNHSEMDHSGGLPRVLEIIKPARIFASAMGAKALHEHFGLDAIESVEDGGSLSIGDDEIHFVETRMLHWPDSMFSYLAKERILFSQDAFGQHLASSEIWADRIGKEILELEGKKYFANILTPYSSLVLKLFEKIEKMNIALDIVAPDHGPIWRKDLEMLFGWWKNWAEQKPARKAVIFYDTMWGSTDIMARAISDGVVENGGIAKVMKIRASTRSDIATEILDARAVVAGSPTLNNGIFPTVADVLSYLGGLRFKSKLYSVFGSYGWSGEAVDLLDDALSRMGFEKVSEPVKAKYIPKGDALIACRELGKNIAMQMM